MRTVQFLILLVFLGSTKLFSQVTITLDSYNGQDVAGFQIIIDTIPKSSISIPHLYITNTSGSTQNWMISRINIQQPNDWFNYLCWGGLCYSPSILNNWSSSTTTIIDGDTKELSLYVGAPSVDSSHYRYYISTDGQNYIDSVDVLVNVTSTVDLDGNMVDQFNLFPNPAQYSISFTGIQIIDCDISVFDMLGRELYHEKSSNGNYIDVSVLSEGEYILVLRNKRTKTIINKRFIIKR